MASSDAKPSAVLLPPTSPVAPGNETYRTKSIATQSVINEDLPVEKEKIATVRWQVTIHPRVAQLLDDTIADFQSSQRGGVGW